jgi:hypothetical protein
MRVHCLFLLFLISMISFGQINGVVKDRVSNEPIPYVNIWVENENIGTTSNENGAFTLDTDEKTKTIIFSSIGYETEKVNSESIKDVVRLNPKIINLKEIAVSPSKKKHSTVIGRFNKSRIDHYYGCNSPWIIARYFEFKEKYSKTPYLKKIQILTASKINSKFNIRFYSVNGNGEPGNYVYDKNFICTAQKACDITEIDVSELNIRFPEEGLFIAVEWLIIDSNQYEVSFTTKGVNKKWNEYAPSFGAIPAETNEKSWIYHQGNWRKESINKGPYKQYKDKYLLLAMELTLTN